ncbi:MAG TPA: hypothetical protein DIW31_00390 [Bacteroidales bacterium]|nr:hypothetical protein [Bacteroidales bacterium]
MKKVLLSSIFSLFAISGYSQNRVIPNPASLYVKFMGYKSKVSVDEFGNQTRVCVFPDSTECDEWSFFRGTCGQAFSYCARKGCQIETETSESSQYAVCVCVDSLGNKVRTPLIDFMNQNGDSLIKDSEINRKR